MATPTVVEKLSQQTENLPATTTTALGTLSTDLLVVFHFIDFYDAATMVAPTGTSTGTWTLQATGDAGVNDVHVKVWTKPANTGIQTIICNQVSDACNWNMTYVLRGQIASPIDGATGSQSASNSTSHVAPSISPASSDDLLLCGAIGGGAGSYTAPTGMTEDFDSACGSNSSASIAELILSSSGATGTKTFTYTASVHNATASIAIAGSAAAGAASIPFTSPRAAVSRDYGETYWLQSARRDLSLAATAANPLVTPLDTAWQASAAYWHLYNDNTLQSRRAYFTQRPYGVDPNLLASAELEGPLLSGADRRHTSQAAAFTDRRQIPQQRPYVSNPGLLTSGLLENELLGGATTTVRMLPATHTDRRESPQQRAHVSDPGLLTGSQLENELLGGADTSKRVNATVTHAARWWMPQQPARLTYLITSGLLENELLGGADSGRHAYAAAFTDRRSVPQQRPYLSDPTFYPTVDPTDPLTVAYGTGGHYWLIYNTAALAVDRRLAPQQRPYQSDPGLLSTALVESPLLGGADSARHSTWYTDRRQVPQQHPYLSSADLLSTALLESPLLGLADLRHTMWFTDRRLAPQQRLYQSSPALLTTALLESPLLGAGDTSRHQTWFADRRETPQQHPLAGMAEGLLDVPYLTRQQQPRSPTGWQAPSQQPARAVIGEEADPLLMLGQQLRALTAATHTDRRRTASQPARQSLYFDAGPDVPPLTVAFGAGGSMWHRYNRWYRDVQWVWWQPPRGIGSAVLGSMPLPGIIVIAGGTSPILGASGTSSLLAASGTSNTLTAGGTP